MQTDDLVFLDMFRYSHTVSTTVDYYNGSTLVKKDIPVTDGSVSASRKGNVRRTCDFTVALQIWEDLPINPLSSRVKVYIGLESTPGVRRVLPQGMFRVDSISRNRRDVVTVSTTSLESYVLDDRFFTPRTPTKGISTITAIRALISESLPDAVFLVTATKDKVVGMTAPWERERWEAVTALAESIEAEVYCNADGQFVIADKPDVNYLMQHPVWRVNAGPDGVLVTHTESRTRNKVYNAVVASGQSSDENVPPVWDVVTDNDPNSPTWWGGPFGHVCRFYANPNFTTKAQCTAAATKMLNEAKLEEAEINFTMLPNPALEPGDSVAVTMIDGQIENHIIDDMSLPLGLGAYSAKTLATKVETTESGLL